MSNINTNATVTLTVNGKQAEDMLLKLKSQAANLEKAIEKAAAAGNKQQLTKLKRELKETNRQISQIENAAKGVEHVLQRLDETSPKELNRTLSQLKRNLNGLERGSEEWNRQCEAIKRVKAEIAKVNSQLRENESLWERMNRKLNDWQTALTGIAAAITGIIMAGRSAVNAFADMDQEMANVRKFTGMNASEVEQLNEDFQKIDTRTGREELNKLAQEAGRLGKTSQEDVLGFVKAADQINVALDDLGEGATLTLSKLTNIFGDEQRLGTEKALLAVGSVINELSQNCTASAPYLANFTQRMAGVGAQAKMSIPEIMGFAAVLDSQGQAVEMSATAYRGTVAALHAAHLLLQLGLAKLQGNWARQSWLMADLKKQGALLASGWGALLAAAVLLGVGIYKVCKRMTELSQSEKDLMEVRKRGQEGIIEEKNKINALLAVARDETQSLKDRHTAIDALNKIIPKYNGQLDDTTGKYKENKKALDDYLKSLTRKYEIEGAKDKLKDIGKQRAELNIKKEERKRQLEEEGKHLPVTGDRLGGMAASAQRTAYETRKKRGTKDIDEDLAELDKREAAITGVYGKDIQNQELDNAKQNQKNNDSSGGSGGSGSSTSSDSKSKAQEEDAHKPEKDWRTREQALNRIAYAKGEKDFEEYTNRMTEIDIEYNQKVMDNGKATKEQKLEAEAAYYEAKKKLADDRNAQSAKEENDYYNELVATEKQRFVDGKVDEKTFNDALELMELEHLQRLTKVYAEGSKEKLAADKAYQDKLVENQKKRIKETEDNEKKHLKELAKIKEDYFGDNKAEKKEKYDKESSALDEVFAQEIKAAGDDAKEKLRIEEAYQKAKVALAKKYGQEYKNENRNTLQGMAEDITEWLKSDLGQAVTGSLDTLMSGMSSIFSGMTSIIQAETEIQTAAIEKRYDKEITQAEGNNYKVKKLEEEKQKELAKKKNEANKKMFAMQVIQAVAQTAQNAISAYGSAAAIPLVGYILAPVAAAMAVAAGSIQIAAIKKQQQASESQGYAKGGFTPKGNRLQEVGVVHAGEWVASQEMLASPVARPIINALDYAQRTNTIGSLRADDVSRTIAPVNSLAPASPQQIIVQQQTDGMTVAAMVENTKAMHGYADTMKQLQQRLEEPFVTVNTVTGDSGIKKAQDEYNNLIRNKTPKSRRKMQ